MEEVFQWVALVSNLFTIFASGIAIYLFFAKKEVVRTMFDILLNYSYQISISELKEKVERLNEYSAKEPTQTEQIVNIFHEIIGQIKGNDKLKGQFASLIIEIETMLSDRRRLTEPKKRALVSELKERLRHLNLKSIDSLVGESK